MLLLLLLLLHSVHDAYGKSSLIPQHHRVAMCQAAVDDSDWLSVWHWETQQSQWTTSAKVLAHYAQTLDALQLFGPEQPIKLLFLCGADVLESTLKPGLWADDDVRTIFGRGAAVIEREGLTIKSVIDQHSVLSKLGATIHSVPQRITNNISSTVVRDLIKTNQSVKYLIPDAVIQYIEANSLYGFNPAIAKQRRHAAPKIEIAA